MKPPRTRTTSIALLAAVVLAAPASAADIETAHRLRRGAAHPRTGAGPVDAVDARRPGPVLTACGGANAAPGPGGPRRAPRPAAREDADGRHATATEETVAETLASIDARCLPEEARDGADRVLGRWLEDLLVEAARRENAAWSRVATRADWERFRDARLDALQESLGVSLAPGGHPEVHVTGRLRGDGYRIENIVFASRPGLAVTANLYLPAEPPERMPAIVIAHSHHRPATQGELQDMGVTWARAGCAVLVPELPGHGERREHPFATDGDWPGPFRRGRQDYYFRYPLGLQLHLTGESLLGWMARDLVRSVDVLLARGDVDPDRIALIGAVAGGGDPAGVTAALDRRIDAVVPFNFGGPQPDYAIPESPAERFYWFGVAYWESTRCLRLGARDGFAHWVIVASTAPRRLVYAHEFAWDRERDPAWPRIRRVYSLYGAESRLGTATGRGELSGRPPESTHCTNVGRVHRRDIHPLFARWFGIEVEDEHRDRRPAGELRCLTPEVARELDARPIHALARSEAAARIAAYRRAVEGLPRNARRERLRRRWREVLGPVDVPGSPRVLARSEARRGPLRVERSTLRAAEGVPIPLLVLSRVDADGAASPVVILVSRRGKGALLRERRAGVARLLAAGATVALVDPRGFGETSPGSARGPSTAGTTLSCRALVAGRTLLGARLRDLRTAIRHLRDSSGEDRPVALWGASLAPPNGPGQAVAAPMRIADPPRAGDPGPALLALLAALFEDGVTAVCADGLLGSWLSVFDSPFVHLPHDALPPGAAACGDIADLAAALDPCAVRLRSAIDATNRRLDADDLREAFAPARAADERHGGHLDLQPALPADRGAADGRWLGRRAPGGGDG